LLFFYSYLLDRLEAQQLSEYAHTDLLAVWRKDNK